MSIEASAVPLRAVRVIDPVVDINAMANKTYAVYTAGTANSYQPISATSISNSSVQFQCNPPSAQTYVNRMVYMRMEWLLTFTSTNATPGTFTLNAQGLATKAGVNPGLGNFDAPRCLPLASAIQSMSVNIGNAAISTNLNSYVRATQRYMNSVDDRNLGMSTSPSMLDQFWSYSPVTVNGTTYNCGNGSNRNPLAGEFDNVQEGARGGFVGCVIESNTQNLATVRLTVVEPIFLSPFLTPTQQDEVALININNMNILLQLGGRGSSGLGAAIWSHADQLLIPGFTITADVKNATAYFNYITPLISQQIPRTVTYAYYEPTNYQNTPGQSLLAGASTQLNFNAVQLQSVPGRVYIFVADRDSNFKPDGTTTDTFLSIDRINLTFKNQDSLLSNASQYELFQISRRNGCNMSYRQWAYDCGSVLCLEFGRDIQIGELDAPGVRNGTYNFSFTVTVTNQTNQTVTPTVNALIFLEGVMNIEDANQVSRSVGVLSNSDVLATKGGALSPYVRPKNIYGGFGWGDIKSFFTGTVPRLLRGAIDIGSKVAPVLAPQYAPAFGVADQALRLTGHGRRKMKGGAKLSKADMQDLLESM